MKKKKVLPVNVDVPVYTYTYYGYPHSIIGAEEHTGDYVAMIEVQDYGKYQWTEQFDNFKVDTVENTFAFYAKHPYRESLHGVMSRKLERIDAIRVRIHYQQYAHPWGAVNLFMDDAPKKELALGDDRYLCRLGYFNREGVYFRVNNEPQKLEINRDQFPVDLMLCRDHNIVEAYLCDGDTRYLLCQKELPEAKEKEIKIGVQIRGNENTYYHWLYRNFIQISCDVENTDRTIDYFYGVEKDWRYDWFNYFLNANKMPLHIINNYGVIRFIKECIDEGKYIELRLDQYHIADRMEFHSVHHLHQNLIYGYDDTRKIICLLGYTDHGNLTKTEISYADIKYQFSKRQCVQDIYIVEYEQDAYGLEYQGDYMKGMIRQYLEGYNSSRDLTYLMEPRKRVYGIKCYEALLSEKGVERILSDRRILHLLYEHKALMKDRLQYLGYHGEIEPKKLEKYLFEYSELTGIAMNIRNLAIKYKMNRDENIIKRIKKGLIEMYDREQRVLSDFLESC